MAASAGRAVEAAYAELAAALLDVEHGRAGAGHRRLLGPLSGPLGDDAIGVSIRTSLALDLPAPQAKQLLSQGLESAVVRGDDWAYALIIKAGARVDLIVVILPAPSWY